MRPWQPLLDRVGVAGLAGLLALLAAVAVLLGSSLPLQQQRAQLQHRLQGLAVPAVAGPVDAEIPLADQLAHFHAGFPPVAEAVTSLGRLQAAARRTGIELAAGEYRLEARSGERLQRYAVVLPLRGSYAQLRRFIDAVLTDLPHAALDDVELRRDEGGGTGLEARLRLTLYLRGAP